MFRVRILQYATICFHLLPPILWRRKWQPTPVSLPGKSHGQRSLVGCSPWGLKESGMTEWLTHTHLLCYFCHFPFICFINTIHFCYFCYKGNYLLKAIKIRKRYFMFTLMFTDIPQRYCSFGSIIPIKWILQQRVTWIFLFPNAYKSCFYTILLSSECAVALYLQVTYIL